MIYIVYKWKAISRLSTNQYVEYPNHFKPSKWNDRYCIATKKLPPCFSNIDAMKFLSHFLAVVSWTSASAYVPNYFRPALKCGTPTNLMMSDFSDFASAMPPKPELTKDDKMAQAADNSISGLLERLGEGVPPPPELDALKEARDNDAGTAILGQRVYELMIERGMLYDENPDTGRLTPTEFDIKANLQVPEVKQEFAYLYKYGMILIQEGFLEVDVVKSIVKDRLIARTGLTPEEFDAWLGY